jgi:hypothetical protein
MKRFNSTDEPTVEEWYQIVDEFKHFEPGDMVEYGLYKTPFEVIKLVEDTKYGKSYHIKNKEYGLKHGSSGFLYPLGTFIDDGKGI